MYQKLFGQQSFDRLSKDAWRQAADRTKIQVVFYDDLIIEWSGHAQNPIVCAAISALRYCWEAQIHDNDHGRDGGELLYYSILCTVEELHRLYPEDIQLAQQGERVVQ